MLLQPLYLYRFTNAGRLDELNRLHLMDCMECGCCSFTCPGKLPLTETFRKGKKMLKEANAK
jgi:electron transport complex protein RnfC